jgi:hypothetical protein
VVVYNTGFTRQYYETTKIHHSTVQIIVSGLHYLAILWVVHSILQKHTAMGSSQHFAETYCTSGQRYTQMERVCFYRMPVTTPGFYVDITYKVTVQMSTSMAAGCQNACLPSEFIQTCPLVSKKDDPSHSQGSHTSGEQYI